MKRLICFFSILIYSLSYSLAQDEIYPKLSGDTLFVKAGIYFIKNEKIKLGTGSRPDGDFKFIRISSTSLLQHTGWDKNSVNAANALPARCSGLEFKIIRIDKRGNNKNGFVYYPIINYSSARYEIDLNNAISAGEIDGFKDLKDISNMPQQSLSDELKKLKDLYDSGGLTKEEYEAAKKKLIQQ